MNIRNRKALKDFAKGRLAGNQEAKKLILVYSAIILGLSLLVTAINYGLDLQIDRTGGLGNMGTRAVLDTLQQVLPLVQFVIALCLGLGYSAAMLRIARGQYVSLHTLKLGFDRFWPLLRLTVFRGLIYLAASLLGIYLGTMLYMLTPMSESAMALLEPVLGSVTALNPSITLDDAMYGQLLTALAPCFAICAVACMVLIVPIFYRYRLASYLLIDRPAIGALAALRESRRLMRRNRFAFFRLDLSLWCYYALLFLVGFVAYGDMLLGLLGITLPGGEAVFYFGFYLLYLLCQLGIAYWLQNRVETCYCLAYDSLLPKETPDNGVVLGNIFQM